MGLTKFHFVNSILTIIIITAVYIKSTLQMNNVLFFLVLGDPWPWVQDKPWQKKWTDASELLAVLHIAHVNMDSAG